MNAPQHPPLPPSARVSNPKRSVLIVDDSPVIRGLIQQALSGMDYDLIVAGSGAEGLALIPEHHIDLALLDFKMGDMTAADFCDQLKAVVPEGIPSVLVTAYSASALEVLSKQSCLIAYLTKPFHPSEIQNALARVFAVLDEQPKAQSAAGDLGEVSPAQEAAEIPDIEELVPGGIIFRETSSPADSTASGGEYEDGISLRHGCFLQDGKATTLNVFINGSCSEKLSLEDMLGFTRSGDETIALTFRGKVVRLVTSNRDRLATKIERGQVDWVSGSPREITVKTVPSI